MKFPGQQTRFINVKILKFKKLSRDFSQSDHAWIPSLIKFPPIALHDKYTPTQTNKRNSFFRRVKSHNSHQFLHNLWFLISSLSGIGENEWSLASVVSWLFEVHWSFVAFGWFSQNLSWILSRKYDQNENKSLIVQKRFFSNVVVGAVCWHYNWVQVCAQQRLNEKRGNLIKKTNLLNDDDHLIDRCTRSCPASTDFTTAAKEVFTGPMTPSPSSTPRMRTSWFCRIEGSIL